MRASVSTLALTFLTRTVTVAVAQQAAAPPPPEAMKLFASSADVAALAAKAKSERKGEAPLVSERILHLRRTTRIWSTAPRSGPAAVHMKRKPRRCSTSSMVQATMVTGGTLGPDAHHPENPPAKALKAGCRAVAKGDFIVVPENTPYWFSAITAPSP
jgi:hypothetical protein